jgi:hypothetical protein
MHPLSPLALSPTFFDDSTGLPHPALLGAADHHRRGHPGLLRAEQDLDLLRRPGTNSVAGLGHRAARPEHAAAPTPRG